VGFGQCKNFFLRLGPWNYLWWLGTLYFRKNAYMWDRIWFMTLLTWQKCLYVGPWKILWQLGTLYFRKKMLTCGTPPKFLDDLERSFFKIMLTCRTKVGLWGYCGAYGVTKQAWNSECSATVATIMMKVFYVTKFARKSNIMKRSVRNVINQWRQNVVASLINDFLVVYVYSC
jgi:hypothetical protein